MPSPNTTSFCSLGWYRGETRTRSKRRRSCGARRPTARPSSGVRSRVSPLNLSFGGSGSSASSASFRFYRGMWTLHPTPSRRASSSCTESARPFAACWLRRKRMESASSHRTRKRQRSLRRCSRATRFLSTGVQGRPRLRINCPRATTLADRLQVAPPP